MSYLFSLPRADARQDETMSHLIPITDLDRPTIKCPSQKTADKISWSFEGASLLFESEKYDLACSVPNLLLIKLTAPKI